MAVVGEAEVRIVPDTRGFGKSVEQDIEDPVRKSAKRIGVALAAAFSVQQVGAFFKSTIDAASKAEEATSKVGVVFGDASDSVLAFAGNSAEAFGQSSNQALEAAGNFGNLFRAIGLTEDQSAEFATSLTGLASDLASFNDVEVDDALLALRSGLVGEAEPLRKFGVSLSAARIEAKALELGLAANKDQLDEAAKAQAAYAIIIEDTALAQGDFARTSDGLANSQRTLSAEFENAKTEIGQGLLPIASELVGLASTELIPLITELGETAVPLLTRSFEVASPFIGTTTTLLEAALPVVDLLAEGLNLIPAPLLQIATAGLAVNQAVGVATSGLNLFATGLTKVSGTIVTGRGLSSSVGGLASNFTSLEVAAVGAAAAVAGGIAVYKAATADAKRYEEQVDTMVESLQEATISQDDLNETLNELVSEDIKDRLGGTETINAFTAFRISIDDITASAASGGDALDPLTARVEALGISLAEVGGDIGKLSELDRVSPLAQEIASAYGVTTTELAKFIEALEDQDEAIQETARQTALWLVQDKEITQQQFDLARVTNLAVGEGVNWAAVLADLQPLTADQAESTAKAARATQDLTSAAEFAPGRLGDLSGATEDFNDKLLDTNDALSDYIDLTVEAFGIQLDYEDAVAASDEAVRDLRAAEVDLARARGPEGATEQRLAEAELADAIANRDKVVSDSSSTQAERARAELDVVEAQDALFESVTRVERAERDVEAAQRDVAKAAADSAAAARDLSDSNLANESAGRRAAAGQTAFESELDRVKAQISPGSPLRTELDTLAADLDAVAGDYQISLGFNADRAKAGLDGLNLYADRNPVTIQFKADVDSLLRSLPQGFSRADAESLIKRDLAQAGRFVRAARGFYGTLDEATPFIAGESGAEDVLIVPTAIGGIAKVVADLASQLGQSTTRAGGQQASGGVVIGPGAIQVVAGPDASPQAIAREVIDRLGYEMTVRGDG